jgi:hypothetical protein
MFNTLCRLSLDPQFGLVLMLGVALVPDPLPLTVTCCFFFSSTDAILLSKLCLSSVLSGWIKVSDIITLVLEPNIPSPRARAPSQLNAVVIKQVIYSLRKAPYVLRLSLLGYYPFFPHAFLLSSYPPLLRAPWCPTKASEMGEGATYC